jgi:hypothetical protein
LSVSKLKKFVLGSGVETMPSHNKRYWVIDITKRFDTVFRKRLPGNLSNQEVATILQRLASRKLFPEEVIAASIRKPNRTTLLEVRVDSPPHGKRKMIWLPALPDYTASYWREDELELENYPEILPEDSRAFDCD